ncbi:MAG: hypothetical protein ACTHL1_12470 [Burkholderiaceae bacterium]
MADVPVRRVPTDDAHGFLDDVLNLLSACRPVAGLRILAKSLRSLQQGRPLAVKPHAARLPAGKVLSASITVC